MINPRACFLCAAICLLIATLGGCKSSDAGLTAEAERPSQIIVTETYTTTIEDGGTGPYKAILAIDSTLATHSILWPKDLNAFGSKNKLPIITWGNGACANSPRELFNFLSEIASQGFLVIAIGPAQQAGQAPVGLVLAGVLATCQVVIPVPAVYQGGQSQGNQFAIDPNTVPLVGSPDANYVVTVLFDYKCPHCQQLHFMFDEAVRSYGGKLAFVLCPTPLNSQCNPYVAQDRDEFKGSCELAKVGLAVWVANREAFAAFESWMFSFESGDRGRPRSLEVAKAKAVELVGQAKFDAAWADPWIDRYIQTSVRIYADTGGKAIPKLVFGSRWVIPEPQDSNDLVLILQNSLAVPMP